MTELPETRESLLLKLADPGHPGAWQEFASIYRPAIYRLARRRGLQDADAEDLSQRVLVSVSQSIGRFEFSRGARSFRGWLATIAGNAILNALTRVPHDRPVGGSSMGEQLAQLPAQHDATDSFDEEYRRAVFRWAAEQVRPEFQESTWRAFWLTAVDGNSISDVARELGKGEGVVYAGRSRVMRRLKEKVREFEAEACDQ